MEEEGLVVCCSKMALDMANKEPDMFNSCVVTNIVPDGTAYVIEKEMFLNWLEENGWKGEKCDSGD